MLAVHIERGRVNVRDVRRPRRPKGFASIRLLSGGICNTFVEPLAAACEILDQAVVPDEAAVAVLGDGKLGLLIAQVLKARSKNVHLYGRHKHKLRIAERAGVETIVAGKTLPEGAYEWVVEATGSQIGLEQAVRMVQPRGTIFLESTVHGQVRFNTAPIVVNEITLIGSRCGRFEPALDLLKSGRVKVLDMISERMKLAAARRAFGVAGTRGTESVVKCGLTAIRFT
jgi:threonine dehydrogenase-like Zn-dependent dehydrogenase